MEVLLDIKNILIPETILFVFVFLQLMFNMVLDCKFYKISKWTSIFAIFAAACACFKVQYEPICYGFKMAIVSDVFTIFFKFLILIAALLLLFMTKRTLEINREKAFLFNAFFLSGVLGAMFIVSANDFLVLYFAIELLSSAIGFLLLFDKEFSSQLFVRKYLVTNSLVSFIYLFGISYLYGMSGSLNFSVVYDYFGSVSPVLFYTMSAILICAGLIFKIGILPFSNIVCDMYENSVTPVLAYVSIIPILSLFPVLSRALVFPLSYSFELTFVLVIFATLTAIWANLLALRQKNIKKLLACSSCANASYMLFALCLVSVYNLSTVVFYLFVYTFIVIGVFAAVIILESSEFSNKLYEFKNFAFTNPIFSFSFAICMLALAGFPVTSGFFAKIYLFSSITRSGLVFFPFLFICLIMMVVSVFYYINLVRYMFEKSDNVSSEVIAHKVSSTIIILYFCALLTVAIGCFPNKFIEICQLVAFNI